MGGRDGRAKVELERGYERIGGKSQVDHQPVLPSGIRSLAFLELPRQPIGRRPVDGGRGSRELMELND